MFPENVELYDSSLIDLLPDDILVEMVELMLLLGPLTSESWAGVAVAESAVSQEHFFAHL